jgi:subtilisin family serine protease
MGQDIFSKELKEDIFVVKFNRESGVDNVDLARAKIVGIFSNDKVLKKYSVLRVGPVFSMNVGDMDKKRELEMDTFFYVYFRGDFEEVKDRLKLDDSIEVIEQIKGISLNLVPNDPTYPLQWHHDSNVWYDIDSPEAWDIETGSENITVAIIDTGVEYMHDDLVNNMWQNLGEDVDGDGHVLEYVNGSWIFDPDDLNGIDDDDNNGYVDDFVGWDFIQNDNDILSHGAGDPSWHGTAMAGIVSPSTNNGLFVAGVCWKCKIMGLRAISQVQNYIGIANGIEYATDNNADVISMSFSFSDNFYTIRVAIQYAYTQGVSLVASAGNSDTNTRVYPAAYPEVIAVGASGMYGERISAPGFWGSNYGSWVDVAAPGDAIWTLEENNSERWISGTSASTPIVAGVIALIKSRHSEFNNEEIMTIVHSAVDPVTSDYYFGTGKINAFKAVQYDNVIVTMLDNSLDDMLVNGDLEIYGSVHGNGLVSYRLEYGKGPYPGEWNLISESNQPIQDGLLGVLNINEISEVGFYTIRLVSKDVYGNNFTDMVNVFVDNSVVSGWPQQVDSGFPPSLADLDNDGQYEVIFSDFMIYVYDVNGNLLSNWPQVGRVQAIGDMGGDENKEIVSLRSSGSLKIYSYNGQLIDEATIISPSGVSLGDINNNGFLDMIIVVKEGYQGFKLYAYNPYEGGALPGWPQTIGQGSDYQVYYNYHPGVGDVDNDGNLEIVIGTAGGKVYVFNHDGSVLSGWPREVNDSIFNSAGIGDINKDGYLDIVLVDQSGVVYAFGHDGNLLSGWPRALSNMSVDITGAPSLGDIDNDGYLEVLVSVEGVYYLLDHNGNILEGWPIEVSLNNNQGLFVDLDNDGNVEIVIASDVGIEVYDKNGNLIYDLSKFVNVPFYVPAIADVNNDGILEMFAASDDAGYEWRFTEYNPKYYEWPQYIHDVQRTGLYVGNCDNTFNNQCSEIQPLYCLDGEIIYNCQVCGCVDGICLENGRCLIKSEEKPLPYTTWPELEN